MGTREDDAAASAEGIRRKRTAGSAKGCAKGRTKPERYERGTRSYTMSHIRGKDTAIEKLVRSYLFSRGLRFRKNDARYPGHPDVVLPKWHTIVFVNGCFWHMHEGCAKHTMPKSNVEFWSAKLLRNHERDVRQHAELEAAGWRVIVVWECELAKPTREERLKRLYDEIVGGDGDRTALESAQGIDNADDADDADDIGDVGEADTTAVGTASAGTADGNRKDME